MIFFYLDLIHSILEYEMLHTLFKRLQWPRGPIVICYSTQKAYLCLFSWRNNYRQEIKSRKGYHYLIKQLITEQLCSEKLLEISQDSKLHIAHIAWLDNSYGLQREFEIFVWQMSRSTSVLGRVAMNMNKTEINQPSFGNKQSVCQFFENSPCEYVQRKENRVIEEVHS